jgi:Galactose oxidase, central domain
MRLDRRAFRRLHASQRSSRLRGEAGSFRMVRDPSQGATVVSLLWTQRQDIGPSARFGHALAYDESRQKTLLVGGDGLGALFRDTWLWDGDAWTQAEDIGPSARADHAIAYDSARSRVVLFGGRNGGVLSDTWEWDGHAWTQVEDTGPSPRSRHALAYDAARSRVVLFGGHDGGQGRFGDTWEWNAGEWTQVADTGPSARSGHAMCFEAPAKRTVLFGGSAESDSWAWDGTDWTEISNSGPAPCEDTALVSTGQSTILFGGIDLAAAPAALFRLTWELQGASWTERQDIGPGARHGHAMALDKGRGRVVLFGGNSAPPNTATNADLRSDTWELPVGANVAGGVPGGGGPPGGVAVVPAPINLISFTLTPNPVVVGHTTTAAAILDQPSPDSRHVTIFKGDVNPVQVGILEIGQGAMQGSTLLNADAFGPGQSLVRAVPSWGAAPLLLHVDVLVL